MVPFGDNHIFFNENSKNEPLEKEKVHRDEAIDLSTLHTLFIGGDRCTFDTNIVSLNSVSGFDGHLIIGFVSIFQTQIVILAVDIDVRKDQLENKSEVTMISGGKENKPFL